MEIEEANDYIRNEVRYISKERSGYDIAIEYKDKEYVIYVVGGDGTLTLVLPALISTKNKLGIIPSGSGNDTYLSICNGAYYGGGFNIAPKSKLTGNKFTIDVLPKAITLFNDNDFVEEILK